MRGIETPAQAELEKYKFPANPSIALTAQITTLYRLAL
jgi:hypothetical protein